MYFRELEEKEELVNEIIEVADDKLILIYGASDTEHNKAAALKEFIEEVSVGVFLEIKSVFA